MDGSALTKAKWLLFYVASGRDGRRVTVGPTLAAAAERAGWEFECYYDDLRRGRHFGGGDPEAAGPGWPGGSLVAGGRHLDQVLWLAAAFRVAAVGDPASVVWPALDAAGAETITWSDDPAEIYEAVFRRLDLTPPTSALVLDAAPQGRHRVVTAPYLYPALLAGEPAVAVDVSAAAETRRRLERQGVARFEALYVDERRAAAFPGGLDATEGDASRATYADLTTELAHRHARWGRGVLLGDPALVAAQLARARRLRLVPLYGRPQTEAVAGAQALIRGAREPVYGRQYDDRDFFAIARLGHGLQILDPDPPFETSRDVRVTLPEAPSGAADVEPNDAQLVEWADEGRVLVTLLFWAGMVREIELVPRLIDLAATTGLAAGLLVTAETVELGGVASLGLLASPPDRGGVFGRLEPLLASTGRGVAAEALMPAGTLARTLAEARLAALERLPRGIELRGWWPLLDAPPLTTHRRRVGWRAGRPVVYFVPRQPRAESDGRAVDVPRRQRRDVRGLVGGVVRGARLDRFLEVPRPFDDIRPGPIDPVVVGAVRDAGFSYMWSKSGFGEPTVLVRDGDFVALSLTAGNWDGWSPFYTVSRVADLRRAERRLLRAGRAGWLAATVDSPLFAMSGEVLERGSVIYRIAEEAAEGGVSRRLVNVTPNVVARYARLLDDRGRTSG